MIKNENIIFECSKEYRVKVGNCIKSFRERHGYSQIDLAHIINVDRSIVSKLENGKFAITIDYLERLSKILNFEMQLKNK